MKIFTLIISLILCSKLFSQRYEYAGINEGKKKYKHEYRFWFDNLEDSNSFTLTKIENQIRSEIILRDNLGNPAWGQCLKITNTTTNWDTSIIFLSDSSSLFFNFDPGQYLISSTRNTNWDPFKLEFSLSENEQIDLVVNFGLSPQFDGYFIYSKKLLKEEKIKAIINCVEENKKADLNKNCAKGKYEIWIMM